MRSGRGTPEELYMLRQRQSLSPECVEEIYEKNARRILKDPEAKVIVSLFRGALVNMADGSLCRLQEEGTISRLLKDSPSMKSALEDIGVESEHAVGTMQAIARSIEKSDELRCSMPQ